MKRIAITGLNGAIGKNLAEELNQEFSIYDLYHTKKYSGKAKIAQHVKFDLLSKNKVKNSLQKIKPDIIIHLAAITHIDNCEKDKINGKNGIVWKTNVEGTNEIAKYCVRKNVQLIFLSTECVFDGKKLFFDEKSTKSPINWYGKTKSEAEECILSLEAKAAIIRSVVAYHQNDNKETIYGKILSDLNSNKEVKSVYDQNFTPTYMDDIVKAINSVARRNLTGIFHVVPLKTTTPYDFAKLVAKRNNVPLKNVKKTTLFKYYGKEKSSLRLKNASLSGIKTNRILDFIPRNPEDAL